MSRATVSDTILSVLLWALDRDGTMMVPTGEVAHRAGVPLDTMIHVLPVLMERGHLDLRTRSGTLKLSPSGITAARAIAQA